MGDMSSEPPLSPGEPVTTDPDLDHGRASEVKFTRAAALWTSLIL